jgi:hypothetical protein
MCTSMIRSAIVWNCCNTSVEVGEPRTVQELNLIEMIGVWGGVLGDNFRRHARSIGSTFLSRRVPRRLAEPASTACHRILKNLHRLHTPDLSIRMINPEQEEP